MSASATQGGHNNSSQKRIDFNEFSDVESQCMYMARQSSGPYVELKDFVAASSNPGVRR